MELPLPGLLSSKAMNNTVSAAIRNIKYQKN
jgi:hypothetical protein